MHYKGPMLNLSLFLLVSLFVSCLSAPNYTTCSESSVRVCPYGLNSTAYLVRLKRGGPSSARTNSYDPSFFLCEEYNYNCGYLQQSEDYLTVAQGMQLGMNLVELNIIVPNNSALVTKVQPYLQAQGSRAQCLSNFFPLTLTDAQSDELMNDYLIRLSSNLSILYNAQKAASSLAWSSLPFNTITAVLQLHKINYYASPTFVTGPLWTYLLNNQWSSLASQLQATARLSYLHSSYLISSSETPYNKRQSINFLIDQSLTVGSVNYAFIKQFLTDYMSNSNDDPSLMSLSYYDSTTQRVIPQSSTNSQVGLLAAAVGHVCTCSLSPYLGQALNSTANHITSLSSTKSIPKLIIAIVGSNSLDDVSLASSYLRSKDITPIVIGVGSSYNRTQIVQIATEDNIIQMSSYSQMSNLNKTIKAFLAKQFIDVNVGQTVVNNQVRELSTPNYYRVPRSTVPTTYHKVTVTHHNDPPSHQYTAFTSPYDPFPNSLSSSALEHYRTSVYVYQYYLPPSAAEEIPLKKNIIQNYTSGYYYFTITGAALDFDIQVTECPDKNCTQDRAEAAAISSQNHDINLRQDQNVSNVGDLTVFAGIGSGLAALGLGTYAVINGLRKLKESPEEPGYEGDNSGHEMEGERIAEGEEAIRQSDSWNNQNYDEDEGEVNNNEQHQPSIKSQQNQSVRSKLSDKSKKSNKQQKSQKSKKSQKSDEEQSNKSEKSNKSQKQSKSKKSNKSQKSKKSQKSDEEESNKSEKSISKKSQKQSKRSNKSEASHKSKEDQQNLSIHQGQAKPKVPHGKK